MRQLIIATIIALLSACTVDYDTDSHSDIVVEGWIDSGGFPVVMLTRSIPISTEYQSLDSLDNYIERWATVNVSNGERNVTLIGTYNNNYYPPYIYTTTDMRGEVGKTYSLTVDCADGTHAEAITTVPEPVRIDSFKQARVETSDTLRQLYGFITDKHIDTKYYKLFTHVQGYKYGYMSSYLGITNSDILPSDGKIAVNKGRINMEKNFTPYFAVGDVVMVKLARIDDAAYQFWRDFEDMTTLSRNPLFPVTNNMHSNIKGGLGYWFGYGSSSYIVKISK